MTRAERLVRSQALAPITVSSTTPKASVAKNKSNIVIANPPRHILSIPQARRKGNREMKKRLAIMLCGFGSWIGFSMAASSFPLAFPDAFKAMPADTAWRVAFIVGSTGATGIIFFILACLGAFSESENKENAPRLSATGQSRRG